MSQLKSKAKGAAKALRRHGKSGQLVTTNINTTKDNSTIDTNEIYSPNWTKETAYYDSYVADGGKGDKEANRHWEALRVAIAKKNDDPRDRAELHSSIAQKSADALNYMNQWSKLLWLGASLEGFKKLKPKAPFYAMTLLADGWNRTTADAGNGVKQVKDAVKEVLSGINAHSYGHVETAVFPKTKVEGDGYHSAAHAQVIVWGVPINTLRKALKPKFPTLADGTKGYWVEELTEKFAHALSYATKPPSYGYSGWPMADGENIHKSIKLPQTAHYQLLGQFRGTTWPAVNIATGDGIKIRQFAIDKIGYKPLKSKSPPADNAKADTTETPPPALTLETGVDPSLKIDPGQHKLMPLAAKVSVGLKKSLGEEEKSRESLYDSLEGVYELALTSAAREVELKKVLKLKGITFNKAADLFLLAVKIAAAKEDISKQRISEWAAALRYLYSKRCKPGTVATSLKEYGGTKECAKALKGTIQPKCNKTTSLTEAEAWDLIKAHGEGFEVVTNQLAMPISKGVLVAARNTDHNRLLVRHFIGIDEGRGKDFLQKVASDLTAKAAKEKPGAS